jgi:hypothetical protein
MVSASHQGGTTSFVSRCSSIDISVHQHCGGTPRNITLQNFSTSSSGHESSSAVLSNSDHDDPFLRPATRTKAADPVTAQDGAITHSPFIEATKLSILPSTTSLAYSSSIPSTTASSADESVLPVFQAARIESPASGLEKLSLLVPQPQWPRSSVVCQHTSNAGDTGNRGQDGQRFETSFGERHTMGIQSAPATERSPWRSFSWSNEPAGNKICKRSINCDSRHCHGLDDATYVLTKEDPSYNKVVQDMNDSVSSCASASQSECFEDTDIHLSIYHDCMSTLCLDASQTQLSGNTDHTHVMGQTQLTKYSDGTLDLTTDEHAMHDKKEISHDDTAASITSETPLRMVNDTSLADAQLHALIPSPSGPGDHNEPVAHLLPELSTPACSPDQAPTAVTQPQGTLALEFMHLHATAVKVSPVCSASTASSRNSHLICCGDAVSSCSASAASQECWHDSLDIHSKSLAGNSNMVALDFDGAERLSVGLVDACQALKLENHGVISQCSQSMTRKSTKNHFMIPYSPLAHLRKSDVNMRLAAESVEEEGMSGHHYSMQKSETIMEASMPMTDNTAQSPDEATRWSKPWIHADACLEFQLQAKSLSSSRAVAQCAHDQSKGNNTVRLKEANMVDAERGITTGMLRDTSTDLLWCKHRSGRIQNPSLQLNNYLLKNRSVKDHGSCGFKAIICSPAAMNGIPSHPASMRSDAPDWYNEPLAVEEPKHPVSQSQVEEHIDVEHLLRPSTASSSNAYGDSHLTNTLGIEDRKEGDEHICTQMDHRTSLGLSASMSSLWDHLEGSREGKEFVAMERKHSGIAQVCYLPV